MNTGGVLLMVGGVWVLCQLFGGNALGRLGIVGSPDTIAPHALLGRGTLQPKAGG